MKSGPLKYGQVPSRLLTGGSQTCVPDRVIDWPSSVPLATLPLSAVQSANCGVEESLDAAPAPRPAVTAVISATTTPTTTSLVLTP